MGATQVPPAGVARTTFAELQEALDTAIAYLNALDARSVEAGVERTIEIPARGRTIAFDGARFISQFALPNFFFHFATAYAILRQKGVPLTKNEFMGPLGQ
ncbi:DUF1993 family protein [Pendulispora albinea]|uniref:DUF1993 domain-containing protein n=1 Tax=Pendulispora albinea TaxID=2741071 RepID=A0ABZ2LJS8_9BACT